MSRSATPTGSPPRRKATLFCSVCGHESGYGGDWIRRDETLVCPDCGSVVVSQPAFGVPA
ncbi:hypothetical protein [Halorarius litoreus]|uniref:hypothetical protein n=1 Tax=Halorarius litoreus TaxID=2962676 RepID=UPI0020CFBF22|nr:hypothetical protein [Halorarius litoreus]